MVTRIRLYLVASCLLLVPPRGAAQDYSPSSELYAGISFLIQSDRLLDVGDTGTGVRLSYTRFLSSNVGLVVDFASYTSVGNPGPLVPGASFESIFFVAGPRVAKRWDRFTVHGHGLLGVNHEEVSSGILDSVLPVQKNTGFTWSIGGGIDYNFSERWGLRLFQIDIGRTVLEDPLFGDPLTMRTMFLLGVSYKWGRVE